jgi:hypothetical protein
MSPNSTTGGNVTQLLHIELTAVVNKRASDLYTARILVLPLQFVVTPPLSLNYIFASWLIHRGCEKLADDACSTPNTRSPARPLIKHLLLTQK